MGMTEDIKERITDWLRQTPPVHGVLVRGIRFTDQTFVCDFDSRDFPMSALEEAWHSVADTFQVLQAQQLSPTRLTWVFERAVLQCVRRTDGAILGVFVSKRSSEVNRDGVDDLMAAFLSLGNNGDRQ